MRNARLYAVLTLLSVFFVAGCGGADRPEMGYCTGTVTMDGKPVEGITVVMKPDVGRAAMGVTNKEGSYEILYTLGEPGTKTGPNKVTFEWPMGFAAPFAIPKNYSQTIDKVDVKPGSNQFDFKLVSDPGTPAAAPTPPVVVD